MRKPGNKPVPRDHNHVLGLIVDELEVLNTHGHVVKDAARNNDTFTCYAKVLGLLSDYRGLQKHLGIKGSPTPYACFKCWEKGWPIRHKWIYPNHYQYLPAGHPLRKNLFKKHVPPSTQRVPEDVEKTAPRERTDTEMKFALPYPVSGTEMQIEQHLLAQNTPLACPLYRLSYFNPTTMVNYDSMHTIGGVIKDTCVKGLQGLRTAEASRDLKVYDNKRGIQTGITGVAGRGVIVLIGPV